MRKYLFLLVTTFSFSAIEDALLAPHLHGVCRRGQLGVLQSELFNVPDVSVESPNVIGRTLLGTAARGEEHQIVKVLVHARADVHASDREGKTPLHLASCIRKYSCNTSAFRCWSRSTSKRL